MSRPKPQSRPPHAPGSAARQSQARTWLVVAPLLLALRPILAIASDATSYPQPDGPEVFAAETPVGRVDYRAGRGLRLGNTGFTVGGFSTVEAVRLEGGESAGELEGVNLFLFFDPVPSLHVFSELEAGHLAEVRDDRDGVRSDAGVEVDRLYADLGTSDLASLRFGKFQTPIGRWNLVRAEPLVWTTSEPLIVEQVFDDRATGAMLRGSVFPRGGELSYSLYGTFLDPIAPDPEAPPAERSAGAHLEWASLGGWAAGASYFASKGPGGDWNHLGGVDGLWRPFEPVELTAEAVFGEGTREPGGQFGLYAQAVVETVRTLYLVGRYERFDPPGASRAADLFDAGLAWVPVYYLRFKADYLFADQLDDLSEPGFRTSFSVLF